MPAHLGRRCNGFVPSILNKGNLIDASIGGRLSCAKKCNHENDIAARYCEKCKHELVVNSSLKNEAAQAYDPYAVFTKKCYFLALKRHESKKATRCLCDYSTPTTEFRAYYIADSDNTLINPSGGGLNWAVLVNTIHL